MLNWTHKINPEESRWKILNAEFEASICQFEAKLNDRPLTYASNDLGDLHPITPFQLFFSI